VIEPSSRRAGAPAAQAGGFELRKKGDLMPNGVGRGTRPPGGVSLVDQSESASGPTYATPRTPI